MDDVQFAPWKIAPVTGGTIDPGDVVGRDDFILEVLARLRAGSNVLIVDPRRMGKTTMLARLCNEPGDGFDAIRIDLEGAATVEECFSRLISALSHHDGVWHRVSKAVLAYVDNVEVARGPVKIKAVVAHRSAIDLLGDVVAAVDERLSDGSSLIVAIDELPMAVDSVARNQSADAASQFLHRLRHLRQSTSSIRWILAGSIGFHHVVRQIGDTEGVIGDLEAMAPGPLDPSSAELLAACLFLGIDRPADDAAIERLATEAGGVPYILHHLAYRLRVGSGAVTPTEIHDAFVDFARDRDASKALTHLLTRLDDDPRLPRLLDLYALEGPLALGDAREMFRIDGVAVDRDELLAMIDRCCDDHYLVRSQQGCDWKYDVLRRVWVMRRELES